MAMLHPFVLKVRPKESAASLPVWTGVGLHIGGLVASGWLAVATLSNRAWVVGLIAGLIFVTALFMLTTYLFPEHRR